MKKIALFLSFVLFAVNAFAQVGTDKVLYENTNGSSAGTYTLDNIKTFIGVSAPAAGIVKSNGTALQTAVLRTDYAEPTTALATGLLKNTTTTGAHTIAVAGTDYSAGTSALATGIVKSTTTTGALTIAVAGDFPTLNQNTTGTAANVTGTVAVANGGTGATTLTGVLKGTGTTAITAATAGTDYSAGTSALATGIVKSTTTTGALTIAVAGDFPTLNQNTTGTSANITGTAALANGGTGATTAAAARTNLGISLQTATDGGASTTTAATFSAGVVVGNFTKTLGAPITAATTLVSTDYFREITSATGITITITAGMAIGKTIELPLSTAAVGAYVIASSTTETFNGNTTYTVSANSGGTMLVLTKMSSTNFRAALRL